MTNLKNLVEYTIEELVTEFLATPLEEASPQCVEIIRRFEPLIRRTWRRLLANRVEYADFLQDVVLRLLLRRDRLANPAAFPGYFRSIIHSTAADALRKSRPEGEPVEDLIQQLPSTLDKEILFGIFLRSCLEQLPPAEQRVLEMEFIHGLSPEHIMMVTGLSRGGISASKTRGLKRLREIFRSSASELQQPPLKAGEEKSG